MTLVLAWVVFPALLCLLALGCGLLVESFAGTHVPGPLLLPLGVGAMIVVAQPAVLTDVTAEFAVPAIVVVAAAGLALGFRRRPRRRLDGWAAVAAVATFAIFAAPVAFSGETTFGGYLRLDDTASWLALTDRALDEGADVGGLSPSSYEATLEFYFGSSYPVAVFLPLGAGRAVTGQDLAWLYQPYLAFLAAMLALSLYVLARRLVGSRWLQAGAAVVAAQSALVFAYALWGGTKEVAAAALLALLAALVPVALRGSSLFRAAVPLCVASAAMLAVLSSGGAVWILPVLVFTLIVAVRRRGGAAALRPVAAFSALLVGLSLVPLTDVGFLGAPAASTITQEDRLANLLQPLSPLQIFGIWPAGDFRLTPDNLMQTYVLVGAAVVAVLIGVWNAAARRAWVSLVYPSAAVAGCAVVLFFGSAWVDAKALTIASPAVVLTAMAGIGALAGRGRRVEGAVLAAAVVGGVVWSNLLAYREANLAPRERFVELDRIGREIAGEGPTLMNDYEPYGARYFLRGAAPEGASELRRRPVPLRTGTLLNKGQSADIDRFRLDAVLTYRTLVLRRTPGGSRPPAPYRSVWVGRFYEVWQRPPGGVTPQLAGHLPIGDERAAPTPSACADIPRLANEVRRDGELLAVRRVPSTTLDLSSATRPASWYASADQPGAVVPRDAGEATGTIVVTRAERYEVWIGGSFRGRVKIFVNGTLAGQDRHQLSHAHPFLSIGHLDLPRGRHRIRVEYGGPDVYPGSTGTPFALGPVVLTPSSFARDPAPVAPDAAQRLCRQLDWVAAVRPGRR